MKNAITASELVFTNLLGHSINVFHDGAHIGHLSNRGGELNMEEKYWEFAWIAGAPSPLPIEPKKIVSELCERRKAMWDKEVAKMDGGWTQWDPLQVETWEEKNRERLTEALKPFGLKMKWDQVGESTWFKITKA